MITSEMIEYVPLLLVVIVGGSAGIFAPSRNGELVVQSTEKMMEFFLSPWLLGCVAATLAGSYATLRNTKLRKVEKALTLWALTNATWWSFGCDVLSGYFAVMPVLRDHYNVVDTKHMILNQRSGLDAVYLCEFLIHVPLCWMVFFSYHSNWSFTRTLETALSGIQIVGTWAYYIPEILDGQNHYPKGGIALYFGVYFGLLWIILPALIIVRNAWLDTAAVPVHKDRSKRRNWFKRVVQKKQ